MEGRDCVNGMVDTRRTVPTPSATWGQVNTAYSRHWDRRDRGRAGREVAIARREDLVIFNKTRVGVI